MGEVTAISWCDHTFNPWIGCQKVSPACDGCYAWAMQDLRYKRVKWGEPGKGVGTRSRTSDTYWRAPHAWNRVAKRDGTTPFVFGGSLMDAFDNHVRIEWLRRYFDEVIRPTPNLVWLLLTKRPQNIVWRSMEVGGLPPNVALGTTAEDQKRWDMNIPALVAAKAELSPLFAFVSCEPLLGPIYPRRAPVSVEMRRQPGCTTHEFFDPLHPRQDPRFTLDWIITGGETDQGPHKARPTHPDWFRNLRDDCAETGTLYHHKQNGEWIGVPDLRRLPGGEGPGFGRYDHLPFDMETECVRVGKSRSGRLLDGVEHDARPVVGRVAA